MVDSKQKRRKGGKWRKEGKQFFMLRPAKGKKGRGKKEQKERGGGVAASLGILFSRKGKEGKRGVFFSRI